MNKSNLAFDNSHGGRSSKHPLYFMFIYYTKECACIGAANWFTLFGIKQQNNPLCFVYSHLHIMIMARYHTYQKPSGLKPLL